MPIASFEEENKLTQETAIPQESLLQGMSGFLVKKGLASNQTSADLTLLVLAGFIVAFSIFVYSIGSSTGFEMPEEDVIQNALTLPADTGRDARSPKSTPSF